MVQLDLNGKSGPSISQEQPNDATRFTELAPPAVHSSVTHVRVRAHLLCWLTSGPAGKSGALEPPLPFPPAAAATAAATATAVPSSVRLERNRASALRVQS